MSVSRNLRFRFTLVSYNILSQTLLNDHSYLYNNCSPRDLEWPRRGLKIVRELMSDQADIICLQEVESDHLQSLYQPRLARYGYECLYKKKTGFKIDGCAIFYKSNLFHLLNYKGVEFKRTDVTYLLNRDNVGIIAVLKPRIPNKSESSHLVIANTHLIFNPNRSDIKLAQLKFFLAELEAISAIQATCDSAPDLASGPARHHSQQPSSESRGGGGGQQQQQRRQFHPTILCGDLNSTPDSEVSRYILKNSLGAAASSTTTTTATTATGRAGNDLSARESPPQWPTDESRELGANFQPPNGIDSRECPSRARLSDSPPSARRPTPDQLANMDHSLEFKSVYPTRNKAGQRYVSTFSSDIVDYIFYTPRLKLESFKELLTEGQLESIGSLPSPEFPSDHITLGAKFTMK